MISLLLNGAELVLLKTLLQNQVRFVIVGGHAVIFHGHMRPAKDLDVFVDPARDNAERLVFALNYLGITGPELNAERLSKTCQQIIIDGKYNTEFLTSIAGVTFEEAYASYEIAQEKDARIPVISRALLLVSKRTLARPLDLEDIDALG